MECKVVVDVTCHIWVHGWVRGGGVRVKMINTYKMEMDYSIIETTSFIIRVNNQIKNGNGFM
jgi:hypothetical protein